MRTRARMLDRAVASVGAILVVLIAQPSIGHAQTAQDAVNDVHALIRRVEELPRFSRESVEQLFGVRLRPDPRLADSDPRARIAEGPVSEVTFIEIRPQHAASSWHISVTIRRGAGIPITAVDRQFIGQRLHGATDGPHESIGTYTLDRPGCFCMSGTVCPAGHCRTSIFVREGSPERAAVEASALRKRDGSSQAGGVPRRQDRPDAGVGATRDREGCLGVSLAPSKTVYPNADTWETVMTGGVFSRVIYRADRPPRSRHHVAVVVRQVRCQAACPVPSSRPDRRPDRRARSVLI